MNKEQLIRILAPLITRNGDIAASAAMLREQTVEKIKELFEQQPKAVKDAVLQIEQGVANDPELQRQRQEVVQAQADVQKSFEESAWGRFFFQHSQDPTGSLVDCGANRASLTNTAISLTKDGVITLAALNEALTLVSKTLELVRTPLKKPATQANLKADETTLRQYCRSNRLSYPGEGALRMLRERFGSGFGGADIAQAVQEGLISLRAETDPSILAQWEYEDKVARAHYLRHEASPSELRAAVRTEGAKTAQQTAQAEFEHRQNITSQMQSGYPPLPERTSDGKKIDRAFLYKLSSVNYSEFKVLCKRYGTSAITARMQQQGESNGKNF